MSVILIIDDNKLICDWIAGVAVSLGHRCLFAHTREDGYRMAETDPPDIVFVDIRLPDGDGLDLLPKLKAVRTSPEIIVITGRGDPDEAERAILAGAWDYIEKPASFEAIRLPILRALEYRAERIEGTPPGVLKRKGIIGGSEKISACLELLAQAAGSDANVLITGETGTGKELYAKAVHYNSARAGRSFVVVDCTALPETLVESVLFGHARGAFTGADRSEEGLVLQADGGTLFLDEIGELPILIQKRFLRVIQEHRFRPVGGRQEISSDFRLVAATNRDLEGMVRQGRFREDLLFRLRTLTIGLPPLRDIPEDIREMTVYYMNALCERFGIVPKGASPEFWDLMAEYKWPGNVRELVQALEKALLSAKEEPMLFPTHLPAYIRIKVARESYPKTEAVPAAAEANPPVSRSAPPWKDIRKTAVAAAEEEYVKSLMGQVHGNVEEACRISGLSRSRLYTLLRRYRPADWRRPE